MANRNNLGRSQFGGLKVSLAVIYIFFIAYSRYIGIVRLKFCALHQV